MNNMVLGIFMNYFHLAFSIALGWFIFINIDMGRDFASLIGAVMWGWILGGWLTGILMFIIDMQNL